MLDAVACMMLSNSAEGKSLISLESDIKRIQISAVCLMMMARYSQDLVDYADTLDRMRDRHTLAGRGRTYMEKPRAIPHLLLLAGAWEIVRLRLSWRAEGELMRIPLLSKLRVVSGSRGCRHVNADGRGCKANPLRGREYCFFHDPDPKLVEKRQAANRTGGAHSRRRKRKRAFNPLETPAQMGAFLRELMNDVRNGDVGVRRANALARLTPLVLGSMEMEQETKRMELETYDAGAPHSRPSASGNNNDQALAGRDVSLSHDKLETGNLKLETAAQPLPGKGSPASEPTPSEATNSVSGHELETGNLKLETASQDLAGKGGSPSHDKLETAEECRLREIAERKKLQEVQMKLYGVCSPDLDFDQPAQERKARAGDMAHKELNAQELERKKEIAFALAPTTMKYSTFNEEGLVVAKPSHSSQTAQARASATHPSQTTRKGGPPPAEPAPQLDYDNQPSPIPGLQNRHLNYLKYMGAPVSYLKRLGFVFPRQHWRLW